MKNTFRKSAVLFTLIAAFAMIFVGCSKDSSSSNNGGGGNTPTPTPPPTGDYGTIHLGDQIYEIHLAEYTQYFDEDLQANCIGIALADGTAQTANYYLAVIPFHNEVPTGSFTYTLDDPQEGNCGGFFQSGANTNNRLFISSGNMEISKDGSTYTIESQGVATNMSNAVISFTISFEGPLTYSE